MRSAAFSPCSITGFFQIRRNRLNPLRAGSTGASVALSMGVTTRVSIGKARRSNISATFNGQPLPKKSVSAYLARKYVEISGKSWRIAITHSSRLPTGCGYGTSGAGALGLSFALNEAMGLSLDKFEAAQLAHIAEIVCRTGLGTVTSVFSGGLTLRTETGAPGIGKTSVIPVSKVVRLVTATFGPMLTSGFLGNNLFEKRVNACGKGLVVRFDEGRSEDNFMELSRKFSDCLNLMSHRIGRLVDRLDSAGFRSSMAMLGESIFCLAHSDEAGQIARLVQSQGTAPIVSSVARSGAHLL